MSSVLNSPTHSPARRQIPTNDGKYVIGVCAMDSKSRSKPMRNILNRLVATGHFEVQIFGDKLILDEAIEEWPSCNFLISFFSVGFPLDKAIEYVKARRPYLVNDLVTQKALFDRRLVLAILDHINVPTPRRILINRDPQLETDVFSEDLVCKIQRHLGLYIPDVVKTTLDVRQIDYNTVIADGVMISKPFVEKPVSGEDHNIYIYFHSDVGGGCRKLFRKIKNKSSEYFPDLWEIRKDGSFIYEEFMDVDNSEDVKVYTMGPMSQHAETRKSPVVDGVVERNHDGKEIRFVTELTVEEREYARRVCLAFGQTICGFDLLRVGSKSYVIDVNGWSFVKGNGNYYDQCSQVLQRLFINAARRHRGSLMLTKDASFENQWRLKGFFSVIRHGDRTPKLKMKFNFLSAPFKELLDGGRDEVILKRSGVRRVVDAAMTALELQLEDPNRLQLLLDMLRAKENNDDVKVQLKPTWNKMDGSLEKLQCILKWGGQFTHAGRCQSYDLGENLRKDLMLINRELLNDIKVYSASETRVVQTAEAFITTFVDNASYGLISPTTGPAEPSMLHKELMIPMEIRPDMLDDSNSAKDEMEQVKKDLKLTPDSLVLAGVEDLNTFVEDLMHTLRLMRDRMEINFKTLDVESLQSGWCCDESAALFRERWNKLFTEFCGDSNRSLDLSKVSDLYDTLKYDVLHNRAFVSRIFVEEPEFEIVRPPMTSKPCTPPPPPLISTASMDSSSSLSSVPGSSSVSSPTRLEISSTMSTKMVYPSILRELYRKAKLLFDYVGPAEYGFVPEDKKLIGLLTSSTLVRQIIKDLESVRSRTSGAATRLYFTKESHVHTLLNLIYASGITMKLPQSSLDELDYLTQITFELYERGRGIGNEADNENSVRISYSPGAYCAELVELKVDGRHAISTAQRHDLTDHVSLEEVRCAFQRLVDGVDCGAQEKVAGSCASLLGI